MALYEQESLVHDVGCGIEHGHDIVRSRVLIALCAVVCDIKQAVENLEHRLEYLEQIRQDELK